MPSERLSLHHAVALGLLQGPTELLPISSSGHTVLMPWLAGWPYAELDPELRKSFEVALHVGAGVALAINMRTELAEATLNLDRRQAAVIALSLAPPAVAGYALRRFIGRRLGGPRSIAAGLLAGAAAMALADARPAGGTRTREDACPHDGLALGLAQAAALIPGISRNGATLTAARARVRTPRGPSSLLAHGAARDPRCERTGGTAAGANRSAARFQRGPGGRCRNGLSLHPRQRPAAAPSADRPLPAALLALPLSARGHRGSAPEHRLRPSGCRSLISRCSTNPGRLHQSRRETCSASLRADGHTPPALRAQ
jgi:hypothetical protein